VLRTLNDAIRVLTTNQHFVGLARQLRLAAPLKSLEYRLRGPSNGIIGHQICGVEVVFAAPDATEFRTLESCYAEEADFTGVLAGKLCPGAIFYDVGSNVGQFLILAAKLVGEQGRVVGFEPHPANHRRLLTNVALNQLVNVRVFPLALTERSAEIPMYGERGTATLMARAAAIHPSTELHIVRAMRGDDLRVEAQLPIPKAVKIDVEGAEWGVLRGLKETLSSPLCELLCLEIHPRFVPSHISTDMVLALVRSFGFKRIETLPRGTEIHLIAEKEKAPERCARA